VAALGQEELFEDARRYIEEEEKRYSEKLIRDIEEALERGATKPSPCKKSWRDRFNKPSEEEK